MEKRIRRNTNVDIYAETDKKRESTRLRMALMSKDRADSLERLRLKKVKIKPISKGDQEGDDQTPAYQLVKSKIEWIKLMRDKSFTLTAIAEELNIAVSTLSKMINRIRRETYEDNTFHQVRTENETPSGDGC